MTGGLTKLEGYDLQFTINAGSFTGIQNRTVVDPSTNKPANLSQFCKNALERDQDITFSLKRDSIWNRISNFFQGGSKTIAVNGNTYLISKSDLKKIYPKIKKEDSQKVSQRLEDRVTAEFIQFFCSSHNDQFDQKNR